MHDASTKKNALPLPTARRLCSISMISTFTIQPKEKIYIYIIRPRIPLPSLSSSDFGSGLLSTQPTLSDVLAGIELLYCQASLSIIPGPYALLKRNVINTRDFS